MLKVIENDDVVTYRLEHRKDIAMGSDLELWDDLFLDYNNPINKNKSISSYLYMDILNLEENGVLISNLELNLNVNNDFDAEKIIDIKQAVEIIPNENKRSILSSMFPEFFKCIQLFDMVNLVEIDRVSIKNRLDQINSLNVTDKQNFEVLYRSFIKSLSIANNNTIVYKFLNEYSLENLFPDKTNGSKIKK